MSKAVIAVLQQERDRARQEVADTRKELRAEQALSAQLCEALQEMWNTSCTNATSTPSRAAFLKANAALTLAGIGQ